MVINMCSSFAAPHVDPSIPLLWQHIPSPLLSVAVCLRPAPLPRLFVPFCLALSLTFTHVAQVTAPQRLHCFKWLNGFLT